MGPRSQWQREFPISLFLRLYAQTPVLRSYHANIYRPRFLTWCPLLLVASSFFGHTVSYLTSWQRVKSCAPLPAPEIETLHSAVGTVVASTIVRQFTQQLSLLEDWYGQFVGMGNHTTSDKPLEVICWTEWEENSKLSILNWMKDLGRIGRCVPSNWEGCLSSNCCDSTSCTRNLEECGKGHGTRCY